MSYWWELSKPPDGTQYPDWTQDPPALLGAAQRLRAGLAYALVNVALPPALLGAGCGLATGVTLTLFQHPPHISAGGWWTLAGTGALWGAGVALPLAPRMIAASRAHCAQVLSSGVLAAALGPDILQLLPALCWRGGGGGVSYWIQPESESIKGRVSAIRRRYLGLARRFELAPSLPALEVLTWCCGLLPILAYLALWLLWVRGVGLPPAAAGWAGPAVWGACVFLNTVCCIGFGLGAATSVALDAALADVLEQLAAAGPPPAKNSAAADDPQTSAYDDVPSGWS